MRIDSAREFNILEDANGFITAEGVIATAGEQLQYGSTTETIGENALFGNMDEWEGLPITLQHPRNGLLTPTTTQQHQVGSVIKVERRGDSLWAKFKLTSQNAIKAVKSGLRGLSAGYRATLDGNTQVGRSNNHLALCNVGRSPSSGIRRDSTDLGDSQMASIKFPNGKTVNLDCSDAEAELLQGNIDTIAERADSAESNYTELSELVMSIKLDEEEEKLTVTGRMKQIKKDMASSAGDKTKMAELQGKHDALSKELEKSKEKMDSAIGEILADYDLAKKVKTDLSLRKDSGEIKSTDELFTEALQHVDKDIKLDSADTGYMRGMITVHANNESMKRQRGARQDSHGKTPSFAEMQKQAQDKLYGDQ